MCNKKFSRYVLSKNIYGYMKYFSVPLKISLIRSLARMSFICHFYHKLMITMVYKEFSINISIILITN